MKTGLLAFLILVWVIGVFLGATYEKAEGTDWPGTSEETTLDYLMSFKNVTYQQTIIGSMEIPLPNPEYMKTLGRVMLLDFEFMDGDWQLAQWVILSPLAIAALFSLIYAFIQLFQGFIPFT